MSFSGDVVFLLRLAAAGLLAAFLGWERETSGKSAGLRTLMLVGIGSGLFAEIAQVAVSAYGRVGGGVRTDPIAAVQAVAAGIGFLGAGVIFVSEQDRVEGLTTAASIWATAAVGLACGFGRYLLAAGATVLLLFVLRILVGFEEGRWDRQAAGRNPRIRTRHENRA
jgi:putative Mg2+ transporter-C (MgtC) family protein